MITPHFDAIHHLALSAAAATPCRCLDTRRARLRYVLIALLLFTPHAAIIDMPLIARCLRFR